MEKSLKRHEYIMLPENIAMVDWFSFVSFYSVNQIRELICYTRSFVGHDRSSERHDV